MRNFVAFFSIPCRKLFCNYSLEVILLEISHLWYENVRNNVLEGLWKLLLVAGNVMDLSNFMLKVLDWWWRFYVTEKSAGEDMRKTENRERILYRIFIACKNVLNLLHQFIDRDKFTFWWIVKSFTTESLKMSFKMLCKKKDRWS